MTENERNEVRQFLINLNITHSSDDGDISCQVQKMKVEKTLMPNISVSGGASKVCLVFTDRDYVIKWSTGYYNEAYEEVEIYQKAVKQGLADFFPKTELFDSINGIEFVLQEKIDFSCYECPVPKIRRYEHTTKTASLSIVQKMEKEFNKAGDYPRDLNHLWAKMALVLYGKRRCKALCNFIIENRINDLHSDNIGYKNNRPIILDFSGYHRDSYSYKSSWSAC